MAPVMIETVIREVQAHPARGVRAIVPNAERTLRIDQDIGSPPERAMHDIGFSSGHARKPRGLLTTTHAHCLPRAGETISSFNTPRSIVSVSCQNICRRRLRRNVRARAACSPSLSETQRMRRRMIVTTTMTLVHVLSNNEHLNNEHRVRPPL